MVLTARFPQRRPKTTLSMSYTLKDVNTQTLDTVRGALTDIFESLYPKEDSRFIPQFTEAVKRMFDGEYKNYGKVTTEYHDREHTLQAALCMARLLEGRKLSREHPPLTARHFRIGLAGILLHDVGYLKDVDDEIGTGAKYTIEHEERSVFIADLFLREIDWQDRDIQWVIDLIRCTGPQSQINKLDFEDEMERFLGQAICTADYLGQMADYQYLQKLPILFEEFEESDDFQDVPLEKRMFRSAEDLIRKTPGFWGFVQNKVLTQDCGEVYKYLGRPVNAKKQSNPYLEKIGRNIKKIQALVDEGRVGDFLASV